MLSIVAIVVFIVFVSCLFTALLADDTETKINYSMLSLSNQMTFIWLISRGF